MNTLSIAAALLAAQPAYSSVDVRLTHGLGEMTVGLDAQADSLLGQKPEVRGGAAALSLSHSRGTWNVGLSPKYPLNLSVQHEAGATNLNLAGLPVNSLKADLQRGSLTLKAPARTFSADLSQQSGETNISLPADTGLQLRLTRLAAGSVVIGGKEVASGRNLSGTYQTDNFASAKNQITLTVSKELGGINVSLP